MSSSEATARSARLAGASPSLGRRAVLAGLALLAFSSPCSAQSSSALPQATGGYFVLGYVDVIPPHSRKAIRALRTYLAHSRAEPGAVDIRGLQEVGYPNRFLLIEHWAGADTLALHLGAAAKMQLMSAIAPYALGSADFRIHQGFADSALGPRSERSARYVAVHLDATPPDFPSLEKVTRPYLADVQTEKGLAGMLLVQQAAPRLNHLMSSEMWRGADDLIRHRQGASLRRFRTDVGPLLGALFDERTYRPLD